MIALSKDSYKYDWIAIIDFSSPYSQLLAKKIRRMGVYSEIFPYNFKLENIPTNKLKGIIFSGISENPVEVIPPDFKEKILSLNVPILGVGYGMKLMLEVIGDIFIKQGARSEYEDVIIEVTYDRDNGIFYQLPNKFKGQIDQSYPTDVFSSDYIITAIEPKGNTIAIQNNNKQIYGVQFHPEKDSFKYGEEILFNFVRRICSCSTEWVDEAFIGDAINRIKEEVRDGHVVAGVSGGIDSLLASLLTFKAIGKQLHCIFINTGLMRKDEEEEIALIFNTIFKTDLNVFNCADIFINELHRIVDPEQKRKIIGNLFVKLFEEKAKKIGGVTHLLQGTLYTDILESMPISGQSPKVKSHHNVAGLPEKMHLKLLEPLKNLFKDEVRRIGESMGLPENIVWRQPFPGPGLAIRIAGEVNNERLAILREADDIIRKEIESKGLNKQLWQYFGVLLPIKSVGVKFSLRTYENTLVLRIVSSSDGMTADWAKIPYELLSDISNRIINEVNGINRVLYDISSKPPATIEWE